MRSVWFAVSIVAFCIAAPGFARDDPPGLLPPAAPEEALPLRGGKPVSRPLTPVDIPPDKAAEPPPEPVQRIEAVCEQRFERRGPLGPSCDGMELLLWWPKAQPLPPLVTASRSGSPPILGAPGTTLLIGNRAIANQDIAGGRFTLGWAVNDAQTLGFELVYFFLGSRSLDETIRAGNTPGIRSLGIPFVNATTGREDVFPLAAPGASTGSVFVSTTTRVQGAEANIVANLLDGRAFKLNGLVGYRFLQVHEGLTVEQMRVRFGAPGTFGPIYDQFDGHNRFHGGQLGLHADINGEWLFCELTGKVALGRTLEVVKIDGATSVYAPVIGGVTPVQYSPGGVLALPSNIGRTTEHAFAVVPEGTFKIGIKLGDACRFYVGYNFIYLSDAVRPGDQVDRTVNPSQIPAFNPAGLVADRPRPLFNRSDFWAQGLMLGLDTRY
jgi:hypothetical protein